jgi:hypothetical protein
MLKDLIGELKKIASMNNDKCYDPLKPRTKMNDVRRRKL